MDSSGGAFSYSRSIPRQVVESRVEFVLWQENGRVHWWRRHIIMPWMVRCHRIFGIPGFLDPHRNNFRMEFNVVKQS